MFAASFATFFVIKKIYGLRVTESAGGPGGLDIAEHGMYGYPEQFIPQGEFPGAHVPDRCGLGCDCRRTRTQQGIGGTVEM